MARGGGGNGRGGPRVSGSLIVPFRLRGDRSNRVRERDGKFREMLFLYFIIIYAMVGNIALHFWPMEFLCFELGI